MIEIIDWDYTEESKNAKTEIDFLYDWWEERKNNEEKFDKIKEQYEKDNQMLKRLIDVRMHLWT